MRHNLTFARMLSSVSGGKDIVFDVVERIVEVGFQETVAVPENVVDAVRVCNADVIWCYAYKIAMNEVLLVDCEGYAMFPVVIINR